METHGDGRAAGADTFDTPGDAIRRTGTAGDGAPDAIRRTGTAGESLPTLGSADVVVVGGGLGGMAAALVAAREGASVAILEERGELGGNAAVSTGYIAFAGYARQLEEGIEDDPERFLQDMRAEVEREQDRQGIAFDEAVAREYAERSAEAYELLVGLGIRFGRFIPRPLQHTTLRMLALEDTSAFRTRFEAALHAEGVRVVHGVRVDRLLTDGDRVTGVRVRSAGAGADGSKSRAGAGGDGDGGGGSGSGTAPGIWRAGRAVVLAAGGYQANHELRARFQPVAQARTPYYGVDTARGDGHLLGAAVGGQLVNMTCIPMYVRAPSALVAEAIAVNAGGGRFHDEPGPYLERVAALRAQPGGVAWYLFDDRTARAKPDLVRHLPVAPEQADTLEGLAAKIGCEPAVLERTLADWNALLAGGEPVDAQFGRRVFPYAAAGIAEPPFHAAPMIVGASFTAGGLRVTPAMEVLDLDGTPIPGLLAVGDCVGAVNPAAGLGGIHLGSAATLGMVAGRTAAAAAGEAGEAAETTEPGAAGEAGAAGESSEAGEA